VGSGSPTYLSEAALRLDGLTLIARDKLEAGYRTTRPAPDQPFGSWTPDTTLQGGQDPTFFQIQGAEHAVVARGIARDGMRKLELWSLGGPATAGDPLSITHAGSGLSVTEDLDGPSVAVLPGGTLLMAHNFNPAAGEPDIYLAQTTNTASPSQGWVTAPVTAVNQVGVKEDDPALSPDGLVLVYNKPSNRPNIDGDLWVSERASTAVPFPSPRPLTEVNSTAVEGSAHLAPMASAPGQPHLELFFSSERDTGSYVIYRAECSR
jgi:hypothetical protein